MGKGAIVKSRAFIAKVVRFHQFPLTFLGLGMRPRHRQGRESGAGTGTNRASEAAKPPGRPQRPLKRRDGRPHDPGAKVPAAPARRLIFKLMTNRRGWPLAVLACAGDGAGRQRIIAAPGEPFIAS